MDEILNRIVELIDKSGVRKKDFLASLGLSRSALSGWASGNNDSYKKYLPQIAEYFNVSLDWLAGNEQKEKPAAERDELTKAEKDFIERYRKLNDLGKNLASSNMDALLNLQDKKVL